MCHRVYLLIYLSLFETLKKKKSFIFGVFSITISISAIIVLISIVSQITLVLFNFSEAYNEESDVVVTPSIGSSLNYSLISNITKGKFLSTPRIEQFVKIWSNCNGTNSTDWPYLKDPGCIFKYGFCIPESCQLDFTSTLIATDTKLEEGMGYGRAWDYNEIPYGTIYITESFLNLTGLKLNETIYIDFKILGFPEFLEDIDVPTTPNLFNSFVYLPVKISQVVSQDKIVGKSNLQNPMFIEYKYLFPMIMKHIHPIYRKNQTVDPFGYAQSVHFNLNHRIEMFQTMSYQEIKLITLDFASRISYILGFNQINLNLPLIENLAQYKDIETYSTLTTSLTCILINITCIIVVGSLFLLNIENNISNYSIQRLIGMQKFHLYLISLLEMLWYFIPSIILSYFIGAIIYIILAQILYIFLSIPFSNFINSTSFLFSLLSCFVIFLISSIPSLYKIYENDQITLNGQYRVKTKEIVYKIERSKDDLPNMKIVLLGILLFTYGIVSCYLYPLGLFYKKDNIMIALFIISIFFIIFGFLLLSFNLENIIQFTILKIVFYFSTESIRELITKNLKSHKFRNRRAIILYSLCLSTVIFLSVTFHLQTQTFRYYSQKPFGTRFSIISYDTQEVTKSFQKDLEALIKDNQIINGYTFMSNSLSSLYNDTKFSISNLGDIKSYKTNIIAVAPNFFDVLSKEYLEITDNYLGVQISDGIYSKEGNKRIIVSDYIKPNLLLDLNQKFAIHVNDEKFAFKPLAFLKSSSGDINMNNLKDVDTIVSFPQFIKLSNGGIKTIQDIPIQKFFISVSNFTQNDLNSFYKNVTMIIGMRKLSFIDNEVTLSTLLSISNIFDYLSYIVISFILIICGFSFVSSIYLNIQDQQREIGIFRSIGIPKITIIHLFLYEALVIILTSAIIGISIGTLISYLATAQRSLYTQIDLQFLFPWRIVFIALPIMLLASLLSIFPSYLITNKEVIVNLQVMN